MRSRHLEEMADLLTSPDDEIDYEELSKLSVQPTAAEAPKEKKQEQEKHTGPKISRAQKRRVRRPPNVSDSPLLLTISFFTGCQS